MTSSYSIRFQSPIVDSSGTSSHSALDNYGFISAEEAQDYCQTRRWDAYPYRNRRRKIYDLFIINSELDWLEIRMGELQQEVDFFVIVEADHTFTDTPKPLYVQENWSHFKRFHSKMIYHILNDTGVDFQSTWARESFSRNAMFDQVIPLLDDKQAAGLGDVILVSDVDEIPRPDTLKALRNCAFPRDLTLRSHFYYYGFQWLHRGDQWPHPQATFYEGPDHTLKPDELRTGSGSNAEIWSAAWHCSYCFGRLEDLVNKIQSFSHTEMNQPAFTDRRKILQRVRHGIDMFERGGEIFDRIDNNQDVPKYLLQHNEKFGYVIDRDPQDGNFEDFEESDIVQEDEAR
ncbi:MAG: hypothetical protein Q9190_007541 [Brigantiaea leucoxantha]